MDRTSQSKAAGNSEAGDPGNMPGPTDADVEAWAERVRLRRQAWVDGPTDEEKHDWLRRERARHMARQQFDDQSGNGGESRTRPDSYEERLRLQRRFVRDVRLATEGLGAWIATWPFRVLADLVVTGREWEEETMRPARRRWIPYYDEDM